MGQIIVGTISNIGQVSGATPEDMNALQEIGDLLNKFMRDP